jgi:hypothetical protein
VSKASIICVENGSSAGETQDTWGDIQGYLAHESCDAGDLDAARPRGMVALSNTAEVCERACVPPATLGPGLRKPLLGPYGSPARTLR